MGPRLGRLAGLGKLGILPDELLTVIRKALPRPGHLKELISRLAFHYRRKGAALFGVAAIVGRFSHA